MLTRSREYVPVRTGWNNETDAARSSPAHPSALPPPLRPGGSPVGRGSPRPRPSPAHETSYVEDIDPRFAEPPVVAPPIIDRRPSPPPEIDTDNPYDSIPEGARSPAESEHSTFTSISQRGINPRWSGNKPPPMMGSVYQGMPPRRPAPQLNNILLDNPDFALPGGPRGAGRGAAGRGRGGLYPPGM